MIISNGAKPIEPEYLSLIEGKRIFLDVGTLLRGILFDESHSARLIRHSKYAKGCRLVICDHVRDMAANKIARKSPSNSVEFNDKYLNLSASNTFEIVKNGDVKQLPVDLKFDLNDDSIVIASALQNKCDYIATLDKKMTVKALEYIQVLPPMHPESSIFKQFTDNQALNSGWATNTDQQGSLMFGYHFLDGSKGKLKKRYLWKSDNGMNMWFENDNSLYFGYESEDKGKKKLVNGYDPSDSGYVSISYDLASNSILIGAINDKMDEPVVTHANFIKAKHGFGRKLNLFPDFYGHLVGALCTAVFVDHKALRFSLIHRQHFIPLDCQNHPLNDVLFDSVLKFDDPNKIIIVSG